MASTICVTHDTREILVGRDLFVPQMGLGRLA